MSSPTAASYWCYRCSRFVRIWRNHQQQRSAVTCPNCDGGFVEELENFPPGLMQTETPPRFNHRRRGLSATTSVFLNAGGRTNRGDGSGDRSPINPVIVLRGGGGAADNETGGGGGGRGFELYYDDGGGTGLRPLPPSMSEFLLGSGFERLLDQLSQVEINGFGRFENNNPPASKSAIESMPTVVIDEDHMTKESHCAVCKEAFELRSEVREMPCKHIYHEDCILPWLSLRNSCPVCRHELPASADNDGMGNMGGSNEDGQEDEEAVGLTIWRLPGGGYAVGRFAGTRRGGGNGGGGGGGGGEEREILPVVYTEMDGGFNSNGGLPRRVSWAVNRGVERGRANGRSSSGGGGFRRVLRHWFACFGGFAAGENDSRNVRRRRRRSRSFTVSNTNIPTGGSW